MKLRRSTQPWLQPTAEEKEVFNRKDFVTDENWEQRCLSDLFEESPIPGAVPRYRKDKEANSISLNALPIPADALGNSPRIVVTMDSDWLEQRAPAATLLLAASNRRTCWGPNITQVLDCSTGTQQHEQMAESIGRELYENYQVTAATSHKCKTLTFVDGWPPPWWHYQTLRV